MTTTDKTLGQQEAAAWRSIAEQIDADIGNSWVFLCNIVERTIRPTIGSLSRMFVAVPYDMRGTMRQRIKSHDFGSGRSGVPSPWDDNGVADSDHNRARVLACLWLAHEAEEEG